MSPYTDSNPILCSEGRHDLRAVPFSRKGAFMCVLEDEEDRQLYLSISRSPNMWMQRKNLVRLTPMLGGRTLPYEYAAAPEKLTISTCAGLIEMCFAEDGQLRVRGTGVSLRLSFEMMLFENCAPRENGDIEAAFNIIGKLLLIPLKGAVYCDGRWSPEKSRADDFIAELMPDAETGVCELAIREYSSNGSRSDFYAPFDDCVRDSAAAFEQFRARFPRVPDRYAAAARLAAWVIWTHTLGPHGLLKHEVVYMTRTQWLRAFGWQQSYQAMAASGDAHKAWQLISTMFDYQDDAGQIPDSVGDLGAAYMVSKPALQGLALDYLSRRCGFSEISREECAGLYDKLARFANWWLVWRDRSGSGMPQYYHSDESPGEFCKVFGAGLPMHASDLTAFAALLTEACGKLAERLDRVEDAARWAEKSRDLIDRLVHDLWNGERFVSRVVKTGQTVEDDSFMSLLPILLGSRLPAEIVDALSARLGDERQYLSAGGITIENMRGSGNEAGLPGPRGAATYVSTLMAIGLFDAGKKELAREIARRCCDGIVVCGFTFMSDPALKEEPQAEPELAPRRRQPEKVNRWSSWTAACFIILAGMLAGE